jgi:transcriptional regulator with XRE-family HTH domain
MIASNIRRLMAREGLTYEDVVQATGLDERTIRGLMRGENRPHARTLNKLALGLGVSVDELFGLPSSFDQREFDRATNPVADCVAKSHPEVFDGWSPADFDELASRFGTGGELTEAGTLAVAAAMNRKRRVLEQVAFLLETNEADLLADFVALLYDRATIHS